MAIRHRVRVDGKGNTKVMSFTARGAIKQFCRECVGFEKNEVRNCSAPLCPLYPFRTSDTPVDSPEISLCAQEAGRISTMVH